MSFKEDVVTGLEKERKELSPKYFYDQKGSQLFDQICDLEEYYVTRTELEIMEQSLPEIVDFLGEESLLIEYGSGSSVKTRMLLDELKKPAAYIPVDISHKHLQQTAETLSQSYPDLEVNPVAADFTKPFSLPECSQAHAKKVIYFPGSTIGNFSPTQAETILKEMAHLCEPEGDLLIGVDLKKDRSILESAYNDSKGVTEAFNLNLLERINNELGANFQLDQFQHQAIYNEKQCRIEMHLVSQKEQEVLIEETLIRFEQNETICTEHSYKYSIEEFEQLAQKASFQLKKVWTDANQLFSLQYLSLT